MNIWEMMFSWTAFPSFLLEIIPVMMILGNQLIKTWWKKPLLDLVIFFMNNFFLTCYEKTFDQTV